MYNEPNSPMDYNDVDYQSVDTERHVAQYLAKVMGWMCVGLFTTLASALCCLAIPAVFSALYFSNAIYGVWVAQLVVVFAMSFAINRIGPGTATVLFMLYAALTGVTFSGLFMVFELFSLIYVFGITAFIFMGLAVYGFVTKRDLTKVGSLALFGLLGVILAGVVNMFLRSSAVDLAVTAVGIVVFIILIAYDTQKIKGFFFNTLSMGYDSESPQVRKLAIFGALTLYLDFINLFLRLLRILGRRRN